VWILTTRRGLGVPVSGMRWKLMWVTENCGKIACMSLQPLVEEQIPLRRDRLQRREGPEVGTAADLSPRPAPTPGGPWTP
jgi:hypothetical protein